MEEFCGKRLSELNVEQQELVLKEMDKHPNVKDRENFLCSYDGEKVSLYYWPDIE